jgi:Family of unknown function (DUF5670)
MIPRVLLFLIAGLLALSWAISFFYWNTHHIVHILVVFAAIAFILGLTRKNGVE